MEENRRETELEKDIRINGELRICDALDCMNHFKRDGGNYCQIHRDYISASQQTKSLQAEIERLNSIVSEKTLYNRDFKKDILRITTELSKANSKIEELEQQWNDDTELISKLNTIVGNHQQQNTTLAVDIIKILEKHWTFDNFQTHTHSWHDKQDCIKEINLLL